MPETKEFNSLIKNLRDQAGDLAKLTVRKYRKEAEADAKKMLTNMKSDLRRWTDLLDKNLLSTEDFEFLINSQQDSLKMTALQNSGLALIRVDQFKKSFINLIIDTTFDAVLKP